MLSLKNIPKHRAYGIASILCPVAAAILIALKTWRLGVWQQENYPEGEIGFGDFGGLFIVLLILLWMPITGLIGFLLGIRSFVLQPHLNGIGLWSMLLNAILLILLALIWGRFWYLMR